MPCNSEAKKVWRAWLQEDRDSQGRGQYVADSDSGMLALAKAIVPVEDNSSAGFVC